MKTFHNIGEESTQTCIATFGVTSDETVFPIRCKKWSCAVCAPINAYHWAIEVANGVRGLQMAGVMLKFITITQLGKIKTPQYAYEIMPSQWDSFRNKWQHWSKKNEIPTFYAAFVEGQQRRSAMPHFHIIGGFMPDEKTLHSWATKSGFGYQMDVQAIQPNSGTAWYVSKYSTKSGDSAIMPRNFRRCRLSEDFPRIVWRSDQQESTATVKKNNETYQAWAFRAFIELGVNPDSVLDKALSIADNNDTSANRLARELVTVDMPIEGVYIDTHQYVFTP